MNALELKRKENTFTNKSGEAVKYYIYYVEVLGIELQVKPSDNTVKQLIDRYFDNEL